MLQPLKKKIVDYLNRPPRDKEGNLYGDYTVVQLYMRLFHYIKRYWFRTLIAVLITIPIGSLDAMIAYALKPYIDGLQYHHKLMIDMAYIPLIIVAFTAAQGGLNYISIYLNGWLGFHIMNDIRYDLCRKLQTLDINFFDRTTSGNVLTRFYRDPESLQMNLLNNTRQILTRFFSAIGLSVVLIKLSWQLAIIAITILLLTLLPSRSIRKRIKSAARGETAGAGEMVTYYTETFNGIRLIHSFNAVPVRTKRFRTLQRSMFNHYIKRIKGQGILTPAMHIISSVGVAIIIWRGSSMVISGELTAGTFTAFVAALIMLYQPIKNLGGALMNSQFSLLAASRIFSQMDEEVGVKDKPDALTLDEIREGITFDDVSFSYQDDQPVLDRVSFEIRKGEKVALVGKSGSGKSTIASLLPRFYEVNLGGSIRIDGVDIRDYTVDSLRRSIGIVFQESFMFEGTIRENLLVGNPEATEAQLWDALEKAYLKDFVESQEDKLEAEIGERGVMLSGGQRQRLAIARALLKDAPIVILDEATSSLDNEAEAMVHQALEFLMADRTVIIIAHRLSTVKNADRIIVIENGRIVEQGTHQELFQSQQNYYSLYQLQDAKRSGRK